MNKKALVMSKMGTMLLILAFLVLALIIIFVFREKMWGAVSSVFRRW